MLSALESIPDRAVLVQALDGSLRGVLGQVTQCILKYLLGKLFHERVVLEKNLISSLTVAGPFLAFVGRATGSEELTDSKPH